MPTCLLEEPAAPPFVAPAAPGAPAGRSAPDAVASWLDGRDYGLGVPVPPRLLAGGCPPAVFAFVEEPSSTWPFC
jgi:hypothetical protein